MNKILFGFLLIFAQLPAAFAEEMAEDFEKLELGYPPDELFVIDGEFEIAEHDGGKVLKLPPLPLIECGLLFGKSSKGAMTMEAKIHASKRGRRSFPRFGLGVHGISGYRVRAVPALKKLELVFQEEVVASAPLVWKSEAWCHLKLSVTQSDGKPKVQAWVWMASEDVPEKPSLAYEPEEGTTTQGKASLWGTPYSGKDILYDDLKVTWKTTK